MLVHIDEMQACKFYDLDLDAEAAALHFEVMDSIIKNMDGGYIRSSSSSPSERGRRVRFFLEAHCTEFYEKAMGIYDYSGEESLAVAAGKLRIDA